jgi:hypothetical protein
VFLLARAIGQGNRPGQSTSCRIGRGDKGARGVGHKWQTSPPRPSVLAEKRGKEEKEAEEPVKGKPWLAGLCNVARSRETAERPTRVDFQSFPGRAENRRGAGARPVESS